MNTRLLIIITKGEIGGAQQFVLNLAKKLKSNHYSIFVGFGAGNYLNDKLTEIQVPVFKFKSLKRTFNPFINLYFPFELRRFVQQNQINVVHFNSSNALFGAIGLIGLKVKKIFTFHGLSLLDQNYEASGIMKKIYHAIFKVLLKFIDVSVFVSESNRESALRKKIVKSGEVIYNSPSISAGDLLSKSEALNILMKATHIDLNSTFIIGSIGRLAYPKNYESLIGAMSILKDEYPQLRLVIIGGGPEKSDYEEILKSHNLAEKVLLAGEMENAAKYIHAFDIYVQSSKYEGMSLTLLEAMVAGLPIIATNVGGTAETLDAAGLLCDSPTAADLAEKIKFVIDNDTIRKALAASSLARSALFSTSEMARKYCELYER